MSKPTHLIISIAELNKIKNKRVTEKMRDEDFKEECRDLYILFTHSKKVSLSEEDIEKRAIKAGYIQSDKKVIETTPWALHNIYCQALKDLL